MDEKTYRVQICTNRNLIMSDCCRRVLLHNFHPPQFILYTIVYIAICTWLAWYAWMAILQVTNINYFQIFSIMSESYQTVSMHVSTLIVYQKILNLKKEVGILLCYKNYWNKGQIVITQYYLRSLLWWGAKIKILI